MTAEINSVFVYACVCKRAIFWLKVVYLIISSRTSRTVLINHIIFCRIRSVYENHYNPVRNRLMYNVTWYLNTFPAPHIPQTRCMQFVVCPVQLLPHLISKDCHPQMYVPCYLFFLITNSFILQSHTHTKKPEANRKCKRKI